MKTFLNHLAEITQPTPITSAIATNPAQQRSHQIPSNPPQQIHTNVNHWPETNLYEIKTQNQSHIINLHPDASSHQSLIDAARTNPKAVLYAFTHAATKIHPTAAQDQEFVQYLNDTLPRHLKDIEHSNPLSVFHQILGAAHPL